MADIAMSPLSAYARHLSTQQSHNEVISELERTIKNGNIEIEQGKDDLSNSKDRAQTAATSVLSLSLIALLKEIIQVGPARSRYYVYVISLVVVTLSLGLQFVVGILTLYMMHIQRKLTALQKCKPSSRGPQTGEDVPDGPLNNNAEQDTSSTTPFSCSNQQDVVVVLISPCSSTNKFNKVRKYLTSTYAEALVELERLLQLAQGDPTQAAMDPECQRQMHILEIARTQLQMLDNKEALVDTMRLVKKKYFIQNTVSYILYITFVLNAILIAFGISQDADSKGAVGPTAANL